MKLQRVIKRIILPLRRSNLIHKKKRLSNRNNLNQMLIWGVVGFKKISLPQNWCSTKTNNWTKALKWRNQRIRTIMAALKMMSVLETTAMWESRIGPWKCYRWKAWVTKKALLVRETHPRPCSLQRRTINIRHISLWQRMVRRLVRGRGEWEWGKRIRISWGLARLTSSKMTLARKISTHSALKKTELLTIRLVKMRKTGRVLFK